MKKPKLTIELVPKTSHYNNVRTLLPSSVWDKLRKESYAKAKYKCEICKDSGLNQGYKHALECHEIWDYRGDEQVLTGLISLCPKCHQAKHVGRAIAMGRSKLIFEHIARVNKWDMETVEKYVGACFQDHKERSKLKWNLNVRVLTEKYNVPKKLIDESLRTRKPIKPTWKAKRRTKKKKMIKRPKRRS